MNTGTISQIKKKAKKGGLDRVSLDQRRHAPTTNGILVFGKDDELRKRILKLSGNFGFQCVRRSRGQKENASG